MGVSLAAISVDSVDGAQTEKATYEVPFPLLSDQDAKVHEAYRVVNQLSAERVAQLKGHQLDLAAWAQRDHRKVAIPSLFLIGSDGLIKWAHAAHDYKTRPSVDALIAALTEALGR